MFTFSCFPFCSSKLYNFKCKFVLIKTKTNTWKSYQKRNNNNNNWLYYRSHDLVENKTTNDINDDDDDDDDNNSETMLCIYFFALFSKDGLTFQIVTMCVRMFCLTLVRVCFLILWVSVCVCFVNLDKFLLP